VGLLGRRADLREAKTLVANHRRFLGGVGAPAVRERPVEDGSALSPANNDPT